MLLLLLRLVVSVFTLSCLVRVDGFVFSSSHHLLMSSIAGSASYDFLRPKLGITLKLAKEIAAAAREEAEKNSWTVVISILDDGANLVYLERMDGTQIGSIQVSQDKGNTAVMFKRPSKLLEDAVNAGGKTGMLKLTGALPIEGGLPLLVKGEVIGAIGVSGVTSAQDGQIAAAGVERLNQIASSL